MLGVQFTCDIVSVNRLNSMVWARRAQCFEMVAGRLPRHYLTRRGYLSGCTADHVPERLPVSVVVLNF